MADVKISGLPASTTPLAGTEVLPIVQGGQTRQVANNDLRPKQIQSNATSGVLQVVGPAAAATRVMTTPDANFTVARTDASQTFNGDQTINSGGVYLNGVTKKYLVYTDSSDNFGIVRYSSAGSYEALPFRILPNNDIVALSGNFVVGTSGKGIDFSATDGTGTSELLNDYEEGTWTATLTATTTAPTTPVTATGRYTKIGRSVNVIVSFVNSNTTGATGNMQITGLPFTMAAAPTYAVGTAGSFSTGANPMLARIEASQTVINFFQIVDVSSAIAINAGTPRFVFVNITYIV
jgi:hypothetical protein